jgi:hypothetical protein
LLSNGWIGCIVDTSAGDGDSAEEVVQGSYMESFRLIAFEQRSKEEYGTQ